MCRNATSWLRPCPWCMLWWVNPWITRLKFLAYILIKKNLLCHWEILLKNVVREMSDFLFRPHCVNSLRPETHICVSKLTIIGSDNGLLPGRRQAIIWANVGMLLIGPLGTKFSEILIETYMFSFKKMHFKMSSGNWWPFCLGLNVLSPEPVKKSAFLSGEQYLAGCTVSVTVTDMTGDISLPRSRCVQYDIWHQTKRWLQIARVCILC